MIRLLMLLALALGGCLTETGDEGPVPSDLPACGSQQLIVTPDGTAWCSPKVLAGDAGAPEGGR